MKGKKELNKSRERRKRRTRARIFGTALRPRLSVFRSNRFLYAQLIDDERGHTLLSVSVKEISGNGEKMTKTEAAGKLGELMARKAMDKKIKSAVFDRRAYKYHGRIKAVAERARAAGLSL